MPENIRSYKDGRTFPGIPERLILSSVFFIMVFFVSLVCCFGLMLYLCAVWNKCVIPILLHVWFLSWGHFAPSFFCAYGEMSVIVPKKINQFFFHNLVQYNVFDFSFYLLESPTHYLRSYDIDKYVLAIVFMVFHVV